MFDKIHFYQESRIQEYQNIFFILFDSPLFVLMLCFEYTYVEEMNANKK